MPSLLTIAVPTYNRAAHLEALLARLGAEVSGLQGVVEIIVSDNASTDRTADVVAAFRVACPAARTLRNGVNLGPDRNIGQCFKQAESDYLWIVGDDDLPQPGVIRGLVELLRRERPAIVYLDSQWVPSTATAGTQPLDVSLRCRTLDRAAFAKHVHVWLTFISGVVIDLTGLTTERRDALACRYIGTSLVQLGWVLDALDRGSRFVHVPCPCVLATAGNTGGYAVLQTFGANFKSIVFDSLASRPGLARAILLRHLVCYLPGLVWGVRRGRLGRFSDEQSWDVLRMALGRYVAFWLLVAPVARAPKPVAWCALQAGRVASRLLRLADRLAARAPLSAARTT